MVTLVEGTVELIIDGQPTRTVQTGEAFMVPNKVIHRIRNVGPGGRTLRTGLDDREGPADRHPGELTRPLRRAT